MFKNLKYLILIALILFPLNSQACTCGHGHGGFGLAGPITTIPAYTLPKHSKFFGISNRYSNGSVYSSRKLRRLGRRGEELHEVSHFYSPSIVFGYGVTDKLSLSVNVPWVFRYGVNTVEEDPNFFRQGTSQGIGDINLFAVQEVLHSHKHDLHASLLAGLRVPSGARSKKTDQGERFEQELQPGSGAWAPQFGLAVSKKFKKRFSWDSNGLYVLNTKGSQDTDIGDGVDFNTALSYAFKPKKILKHKVGFDLIGELNGSWRAKVEVDGAKKQNEGGTLIYLSPGFRVKLDDKWITNVGFGFPVIEALNGVQDKPGFRVTFGINRVF